MSIINAAIQKDFGNYPWFSIKQQEIISEKYGDDILQEIKQIICFINSIEVNWENESLADFGSRARVITKNKYPLLEDTAINRLVTSVLYNWR